MKLIAAEYAPGEDRAGVARYVSRALVAVLDRRYPGFIRVRDPGAGARSQRASMRAPSMGVCSLPRAIHALAALLAFSVAPSFAQEAAGNAEAGQKVYNQCRACHTINQGGRTTVGPNLFGIVGRRAGSIEGFRYSAPMRAKHDESFAWTEENLRGYIRNPKNVVPGGSMSYAGLRNEQQLNDLMAYLQAQQ